MTAWLLKTEPAAFSFEDLRERVVEPWDGVANPTALQHLRAARVGEPCVIYHTGGQRQAMGLAAVERAAYPDPKQDDPRRVVIDVRAGAPLRRPVRLDELKASPLFTDSPLLRISRLSVVPLTDLQYRGILALSETGSPE